MTDITVENVIANVDVNNVSVYAEVSNPRVDVGVVVVRPVVSVENTTPNVILGGTEQKVFIDDSSPIITIGHSGGRGPEGPAGIQGVDGPQGIQGLDGPQGVQGSVGQAGPVGPIGPTGLSGPTGLTGLTGPTGPQGSQGVAGPIGPTGLTGPQGSQGSQGPQGPQGPTGPQGIQGVTGSTGPKGEGLNIVGSVANQAALPGTSTINNGYITNDTGHLWVWNGTVWVDTGLVRGPQGAAGSTGSQGSVGPAGQNGVGVPSGGSTGQVLSKVSNLNHDTAWVNQTGGSGGSGGGGGGESFAADLGEIIANEPYVLTHDLDTWDLVYSIVEKDSASPNGGVGEFVDAEVKSLSPNTVSITFTSPAAANKYRFIIGGGGSSSHSSLTDLTSDDHTQYLNNARGDARYSLIGHDHDSEYLQPANILAGNNVTVDLSTTPGSAIISASGSQWPPDIPPTEPSSYDYEFEATGDTLPSGWQWLNQGTSTYREQYGAGYLTVSTGAGFNNRVVHRSISTDPSFEYRAKFRLVSIRNANYFTLGFFLTDGTRLAGAVYDNRGAKWILWNTPTSFYSEYGNFPLMIGDTLYLSLRKNSETSWDIGYSTDGAVYSYYYTGVNFGSWLTPTGLGFGFQNGESVGLQTVACEWMRKVA